MLHTGGTVGSVGVNYLPVNSAPVVDDLVVVPGARLNAQSQAGNQPPTINIAFSLGSPEHHVRSRLCRGIDCHERPDGDHGALGCAR